MQRRAAALPRVTMTLSGATDGRFRVGVSRDATNGEDNRAGVAHVVVIPLNECSRAKYHRNIRVRNELRVWRRGSRMRRPLDRKKRAGARPHV